VESKTIIIILDYNIHLLKSKVSNINTGGSKLFVAIESISNNIESVKTNTGNIDFYVECSPLVSNEICTTQKEEIARELRKSLENVLQT